MKVVSITGYSGSGKTTFIRKVSSKIENQKVGVIKHLHEFETKNKDTGKILDGESDVVVAATDRKTFRIKESESSQGVIEDALDELEGEVDIVLLEGFKKSKYPKIVIGDIEESEIEGDILLRFSEISELENKDINKVIEEIENLPHSRVSISSMVNNIRSNDNFEEVGAIGTFTGVVRGQTNGKEVTHLHFEKYEGAFEKEITKIEEELKNRKGIVDARIHHKDGKLGVGEDIVYIVVAASHREQLFPSLKDGIELVKKKAPIWKKEVTTDNEEWVHDRMKK